jgi:hypothetical protein
MATNKDKDETGFSNRIDLYVDVDLDVVQVDVYQHLHFIQFIQLASY